MRPQFAFALLLVLFANPLLAAPEARQYQLSQRAAGDVADQIRDLYPGDELTVTSRGQQVIVRAEPALLDEIGQLVETLDVAPVQMRVTVRSRNTGMGKQGGGGVSINNNQVNVEASRKTISTQQTRERTLIVQEGQSAQISSGQVRALPVAIRGGRNPAAFLEKVETRSGFIVSPQVISDRAIELNIVSFEEDPDTGVPGYETEALMTLRRVEPGQWVSLGSTRQSRSGSQAGIVYQTGQNSSSVNSWEVRVDLM
ncbi:type II and III secretion system protein [Marinobacter confluentis]|uniref:Secretin n=1 Tax=Marinobacter confluentis TaxID=1697557 RepID=A0A4Z1BGU1_9GAMM|nr:type II and III secretion system protein [Marinobacter confluentis]TGN38679.1 secretin [Marinobacter confluentis]